MVFLLTFLSSHKAHEISPNYELGLTCGQCGVGGANGIPGLLRSLLTLDFDYCDSDGLASGGCQVPCAV